MLGAVLLLDTTETIMEQRAGPEETERRGLDDPRLAIELEAQHMTQPAEAGAIQRLGKHSLRIETGNERLRADDVRDTAGGEANGAVGPEVDAQPRERRQHQDGGEEDPFPQSHAVLRRRGEGRRVSSAPAAPRQPRAGSAP